MTDSASHGSYERVNFALRPAKSIERKMVVDALGRLREFGSLEEYRYVGFGSAYFVDFSLVHRRLGIRYLVSIEKDEDNRARFEHNSPFGFIELRFGHSSSVLPTIDWRSRSIVWLDYDGKLDATVISDVKLVAGVVPPGSVVMVTVNAHPERGADRLGALVARVGEGVVPLGTTSADLGEWGLAKIGRRILDAEIHESLRARQPIRGPRLEYRQLFNFQYRDGQQMSTVGGIVVDAGQRNRLEACAFGEFAFVRTGDVPYSISVPILTLQETRYLAGQMPIDLGSADLKGIPPEDVTCFVELYRYFPAFVDADL